MDFIDASGYGLAGAAADAFSNTAPMFDFAKVVAPTLDPAALTGVAGTLAEEGKDVATGLMPNLTAPTTGLAGSVGGFVGSPTSYGISTTVTPQLTDAAKMMSTSNPLYDPNWKPEAPGMLDTIKGYGADTMKYLNDNSKGLEAGGKLVGSLGGLYYQNQMAGLAKQQLNDQRANTAYNRGRQATSDKSLADASARVFGVSTPYTDAAQGIK